MDNFVKLIDALAWPIAVLILAFGFRTELRNIFRRMSKFKYKELEAIFDNELSQVENRSKLYIEPEEKPLSETPEEEKNEYVQLLRIAEVSPRASITESWRKIESVADQIASGMGMERRSPGNSKKAISSLVLKKQINPSLLEDYNNLRKLRNQAAHAEEFDISQTEAERYAALAIEITAFLKRFI